MDFRIVRLIHAFGCFAILVAISGCGGGGGTSAYVPSDSVSRDALTAALTAWKDGKPLGRIETTKPPTEPLDWQWKAGQKLRAFEIVGEVASDGPKQYRVRITLEGAPAKEVIYVIVGRDPLWVFREEDYKRTAGM
jgi:hypothetical protein